MTDPSTHFIRITTDHHDRFYLKSSIDEKNSSIEIQLTNLKQCWTGQLNREQVQTLAKKFPTEKKDSFYSHTQFAFSKGNQTDDDRRSYVFSCKRVDKNRLEFVWKEKIPDLNSLKTVGSIELHEQPAEEVLSNMFDYAIKEVDHQRTTNEQRVDEIQRTNQQLQKALETIQRTVDLKEQLEADLYRKFVLVLNTKKAQLAKVKDQLDSYENHHSDKKNGDDMLEHTEQNFDSPNISTVRSVSPTFDEENYSSHKRTKYHSDETNTSDEEIKTPQPMSRAKLTGDHRVDSALDLGDDQLDYKTSTVSKHHHRAKQIPDTSAISTRPFVHPTNNPPIIHTPSLPEESQTTDDILNKI